MAHPKIIVVGGGLAGLAATIKIAEMGGHVDLFSIVPVKRSHSVCAQGGINAAKNLKGEGDSTWHAFRRHHLWRRLPGEPAAGEGHVRRWRPASSTCSTAWAFPSTARRKGCSTSAALAARSITAPHSPARPPASNCSTRSTSRCGATRPKAKSPSTKPGSFSPPSSTMQRVCHGICALDLRSMQVHTFPAEAVIMATGGNGAIFGKSTNSVVCTGSAQSALYQQGAFYANGEFIQVHPTCIPGEDKLRLMSESARGEGGRVWVPKQAGRQARSQEHSRQRALVLPGRVVSQVRQPGAARHRHPRDSQSGLRAQPRHRRPADGLPRPDAHRSQDSRPQAGRHSRNLREVCGRRSARYADEDLPRHALHHGRPVGGLRAADQHRRPVRRRRVRLLDSRRQPPGREFADVVHLWRICCRAARRQVCAQRDQERASIPPDMFSTRNASGRKKSTLA